MYIFLQQAHFLSLTGKGGREKSGKVGPEGHMEEMVRHAEEAHVGVLRALRGRYVELSSAVSDTAFLQQHVEATLHSITDLHTAIDQDVSLAQKQSAMILGKAWPFFC